MSKRFITYFQSVLTIGIMNRAENEEEASSLAGEALRGEENLNYCYFDQTNFEQAGKSEEWTSPNPIPIEEVEGLRFTFEPTPEIKNVIAARLHKNVSDLTNEDYANFVRDTFRQSPQ